MGKGMWNSFVKYYKEHPECQHRTLHLTCKVSELPHWNICPGCGCKYGDEESIICPTCGFPRGKKEDDKNGGT